MELVGKHEAERKSRLLPCLHSLPYDCRDPNRHRLGSASDHHLSMALSALSLPFGVVPFLILMNDPTYVGKHRNGWIGNAAVIFIVAMAFVLSIVTTPLEILGG